MSTDPDPRFMGGETAILVDTAQMAFAITCTPEGVVDMRAQIDKPTLASNLRRIADELDPATPDAVAGDDGIERIPEAFGSEDGETWWVQGHIAPAVMVLACVLEEGCLVDDGRAMEFLTGRTTGAGRPVWAGYWPDARANVKALIDSVGHVWLREDPDNEEIMHQAKKDEPGATAWTVLRL